MCIQKVINFIMFHISEERVNKARENNYYCQKVTDELPQHLLQELKGLSKESVVKVPIRLKGITSGQPLRCFWNSNIIAQTFGGRPVYGWLIHQDLKDGIITSGSLKGERRYTEDAYSFSIVGHGCWLTPEGKLVDVTAPNEGEDPDTKFRYFLPTDILLKLNGSNYGRLRSFDYTNSVEVIKKDLEINSAKVMEGIVKGMDEYGLKFPYWELGKTYRTDYFFPESIDLKKYLNKVIDAWAFPETMPLDVLRDAIGLNEDTLKKVLSPHITIVDESHPLIEEDYRGNQDLKKMILDAANIGKNLFEINRDFNWCNAFIEKTIDDLRFLNRGSSVSGISTTNGKTIYEIPPKEEVISNNTLPRNKKRRRKIEKKAKNTAFTPQELMTLNNEFLFPHPYLLKKNGNQIVFV